MSRRDWTWRLSAAFVGILLFFASLDFVYETGFARGYAVHGEQQEVVNEQMRRLGFCEWVHEASVEYGCHDENR